MTQTMTEQKVQLRFSSLLSFYCGDFGRGCMGGGGGTFNPAWITEWPPEVHLPLKSLRDSGWTWSEWETTQCFCDTSCLLPHHALVCLGLCFYFLSASTFQVSFTEMSASFIYDQCMMQGLCFEQSCKGVDNVGCGGCLPALQSCCDHCLALWPWVTVSSFVQCR